MDLASNQTITNHYTLATNHVRTRQRNQRVGKRRSKAAQNGTSRHSRRDHSTSNPSSCQEGRCQAHLEVDVPRDAWYFESILGVGYQGRVHVLRTRKTQNGLCVGRCLCFEKAREDTIWIWGIVNDFLILLSMSFLMIDVVFV